MNASARSRGFARFWRLGVVILGVVVVAFAALVFLGRQSGALGSQSSSATSGKVAYSPAGTAAILPAATAAPSSVRSASGAPAATAAAYPQGAAASSGSASGNANVLNAPLPPAAIDQKLIRTGTITITVKDVTGTQNDIWGLAGRFGGAVISSNTSGTGDDIRADVTFRVPSERFKDAMDSVRGYAVKVTKEQSTAQDVTEDYVDLQARQRTLEATSLQLQSLLAKATTVDETLKVQVQLNNVQSDLERIKGKLNYYDNRTAFSTISVSLLPVLPVKQEPVTPVAKWSFSHSVAEAWNRSVNGLQNVADALITLVVGGWWIEVPLIVAILVLVRRGRRKAPPLVPAVVTPVAPSQDESGSQ